MKYASIAALICLTLPAHADDMVVAGGCFWCVESNFESVPGVTEVTSGYTGGTVANPTYQQVSGKRTGHYEAVRIEFDPDVVSRDQLYHLFFRSIDPLDAGGQFCDRGSPYRSAIFVTDGADRQAAETALAAAGQALNSRIETVILPRGPFYEAEDYHQDYARSEEFTWRGVVPSTRAEAYAYYRQACGRDARVRQIWGDAAAFVDH